MLTESVVPSLRSYFASSMLRIQHNNAESISVPCAMRLWSRIGLKIMNIFCKSWSMLSTIILSLCFDFYCFFAHKLESEGICQYSFITSSTPIRRPVNASFPDSSFCVTNVLKILPPPHSIASSARPLYIFSVICLFCFTASLKQISGLSTFISLKYVFRSYGMFGRSICSGGCPSETSHIPRCFSTDTASVDTPYITDDLQVCFILSLSDFWLSKS